MQFIRPLPTNHPSSPVPYSFRIHSALRVQKQLTTTRPQSLEAQRKELNMALVLICIVVLFILCQSVKGNHSYDVC